MKKVFCTGLVMTIIVLFLTPVFAKPTITPALNVREEYNDNIFLEDTNEEDDFITHVTPSIEFNYIPSKVLELNLFYGLNFKFYDSHSNLNDEDIEDVQRITLEAHIKPLKFFFIDVTDSYGKVPLGIRRNSALDNSHENMTNKNDLRVSPYVELPLFSTVTLTSGYNYENVWYDDETVVSYENHSAFSTLEKKFTSRINGALKYQYLAHRPDSEDEEDTAGEFEYNRHMASISVDYRIMNDITINAEVGEVWFEYKDTEDNEESFWVVGIDDVLKFTEYTSLEMNYGVHFRDSSDSGALRSQEVNLIFKTG